MKEVALDKGQRNRLLGKETERDPKAKYLVEIAVRPFNGNEYYKDIYDSKGVRVGGNLSTSRGQRA
jgi:hypothetical protein